MISLHVIAEDLSPSHLLAAIKHWFSKFEQEIMNTDDGPAVTGKYAFDHDGKATAVHWAPTYNHDAAKRNGVVQQPDGSPAPITDEDAANLKAQQANSALAKAEQPSVQEAEADPANPAPATVTQTPEAEQDAAATAPTVPTVLPSESAPDQKPAA